MQLEAIVVEPKGHASDCVIWMHGLGADGHDFANLLPMMGFSENHSVRFIFPHAPVRPVTLNQGHPMRAWYDIFGISASAKQDEAGIHAMNQMIVELIQSQIKGGIASSRILLAGFSQGGAMALFSALSFNEPLAGVMALSTYLPLADMIEACCHTANRKLPIFMSHGQYDGIIPLHFAEGSKNHLLKLGYPVDWQVYPMDHSVCAEELVHMRSFLNQALPEGRLL